MRTSRFAPLGAAILIAFLALLAAPVAEDPACWEVSADTALRTASVPFVENAGQAPTHVRYSATTFAGSVHVQHVSRTCFAG